MVHGVLYLVPNRFQFAPVHQLPLTALDAAVPFVPWTAWIYWSDYLLVFVAFSVCVRPGSARAFAVALFATILAGTAVHWVFPTVFPRELFPVPEAGVDPVTRWALEAFRGVDSPASCMPSLHVASSFVAAFVVAAYSLRTAWPLLLWATAIALATLTTRQHYVADVVAGVALAFVTALTVPAWRQRAAHAFAAARR